MTTPQIISLQSRLGVTPDGFFGPRSRAALQSYLRAIGPASGNPWPPSREPDLRAYYGPPGDESNLVAINVSDPALGIRYDGQPVTRIRCHRLVADSLLRVLRAIAAGPHAGILAHYDGCYNDRSMRGGTARSLHSWGIAIDLDAAHNSNLAHWPDAATMPLDIMVAFAREGWTSAGAFWGRDAMHFQATRP